MSQQEFLSELEEIVELAPGELSPAHQLDDLENWNSLATMSVIAMISEKCGRVVSPRQLASAMTVEDLMRIAGVE